MCATWNKKEFDPNLLTSELERARRTDKVSGEITFSGFAHQYIVAIIYSSITFHTEMPQTEKRRIIHAAVWTAAQRGRLTPESIIKQISRGEREFAGRYRKNFVVATRLSLRYFASLTNTAVSGHRITFSRDLPNHFRQEHRKTLELARETYGINQLPERYAAIRISTSGRSKYEALEAALDAIDLLRGIWNLRLGSSARMSSGKREPVNKLVLGPVHTLHETNGKRAGDVFWYEPNYVGPIRPRTSSIEWQELRKFEKSVRRKLSKSSYRERLEDFIRQYTRALDSRDWNGDFIRLWGLFEQLTSAERGVDAIKRALFLYHSSDRTFNRQVLNHLRIYRNRTIHAGEQETEEIETLLYQLKGYVDELLLFHIRWAGEFSSFEKAIDFLNQSPDTTILQDRMNLLTKALQFHAQ